MTKSLMEYFNQAPRIGTLLTGRSGFDGWGPIAAPQMKTHESAPITAKITIAAMTTAAV